jgi:N-acetylneuraminate lyase
MTHLEGIIPALLTPIGGNGDVAVQPLERLLEKLYGAGVHGMYVCGQTGEGLLQTASMRKQAAEVVMACTPKGRSVIVHVGAYRPGEAIELARHARSIGAHAVSSLPPIGGYTFEDVRAYYEKLAAAADLPVLVYYYPEVSAAIRTIDQILELCAIPGVIGLKFTDFDLYRLSLLSVKGKVVFNGRDEVLAAGLLMGAHGGIGTFYNLVPELFLEVYRQARAGDWAAARRAQDRINQLIELSLRFPVLAAVKKMMTWSGIDCGPCLAPRRELSPAQESGLKSALEATGFEQLTSREMVRG